MHAPYNISLLFAGAGKPHTIGEQLILSAVREILYTVLHKSLDLIIAAILLIGNSVQRRIDKMADSIKILCATC